MSNIFKKKPEAVAPHPAAASSDGQNSEPNAETSRQNQPQPAAPSPPETDQTSGKLFKAVLISLFICPGFGHRHLGRTTAAWIILGVFLGSFTYLGFTVNHLVQEVVKQMQTHHSGDPFALVTKIEKIYKNDPDVDWALKFLLVIYFGAPIELAWTWWQSRPQKSGKSG